MVEAVHHDARRMINLGFLGTILVSIQSTSAKTTLRIPVIPNLASLAGMPRAHEVHAYTKNASVNIQGYVPSLATTNFATHPD
ncbi:hypothetical protein BDY19DRAFT_970793 [Irpex rosettiformis]|uniref:Uncharacterized protein n=1 Tax=Irpex rosettiformis TaxID=378272 RepID=A0ACB8TRH7_9APHY|nr:hypothetical protein BDY19DRAFT_970793 [Irpex rosettiformis]